MDGWMDMSLKKGQGAWELFSSTVDKDEGSRKMESWRKIISG